MLPPAFVIAASIQLPPAMRKHPFAVRLDASKLVTIPAAIEKLLLANGADGFSDGPADT